MTSPRRRGGAPLGNRFAAKLPSGPDGLRVEVYLNSAQVAALDEVLWQRGQEPTPTLRRAYARELLARAIADVRRSHEPIFVP